MFMHILCRFIPIYFTFVEYWGWFLFFTSINGVINISINRSPLHCWSLKIIFLTSGCQLSDLCLRIQLNRDTLASTWPKLAPETFTAVLNMHGSAGQQTQIHVLCLLIPLGLHSLSRGPGNCIYYRMNAPLTSFVKSFSWEVWISPLQSSLSFWRHQLKCNAVTIFCVYFGILKFAKGF